MMQAIDFFESVLGTGAGYATIVTKDGSGNPTVQKFFSYPDELDAMAAYAKQFENEDVYFSPILFYETRRIRENAKSVSAVYSDADTCDPKNFRLQPSIIVKTSEGRWHAYWILDAEADPHRVAMASKQVAYGHKDQGCDLSGWNPTKLLRVPNSRNTKYGDAQVVEAVNTGLVYKLEEVEAAYADVKVDAVLEPSLAPMPEITPDVMGILGKIKSNTEVLSLFMDEPGPNADYSRMLWKLELELFRQGLTIDEVFAVAKHARCNKYRRPDRPKRSDPDGDLWREIQRAHQTFQIPAEVEQVEAIFIDDTPPEKPISFLTDAEREIVSNTPTFIDKYVAWAGKKTDGAVEYQIASAFTMLSTCFSDIGYATPKYGKLGLNLWFMLLGETTLSRKSTSRQLMLRMLRSFEKFAGYQIDIGSNVTAEGLVKHLSGRDKLTSLFHRDEVQGMFKEFVTKTYMAAAADQFTELYDGHVPVVIRATGAASGVKAVQSERAETNFLMYLMGITSKVAEILTVDYFRSGFLARFVYVIADSPERTFESEAIEQSAEIEVVKQDDEMEQIVRTLYDSTLYWQKKGAPFPRPVRMTDDALARFNKFKWDMGNFTVGHPNEESIEPSRQRLALSIWKCAVLLAMYDKSDEVEEKHVLVAVHYAEQWFKNLVRMADSISASEWQREVDELEALLVTKGGRMRYEEAYKKFGNKRKREFDEMVDALKSQARIAVRTENMRNFLEVTGR
jgi:hypothetical protein